MAEDDLIKRANAYRSSEYAAAKSRSSARSTNSRVDARPGIGKLLAGAPVANKVEQKQPDFWQGLGEALDKPVIKQIIDVLSSGTYAAGNATSDALDLVQHVKDGQGLQPTDLANLANIANPGNTLAKGVMGGFGVQEMQKTQGEGIKRAQEMTGIDPNSDASKNVQFWGGLAGDIALDPLTYVGVGGATAAAKGAVRGSKAFKAEKALAAKEGRALTDTVESTRWANAKKQASVEVDKYREGKLDIQQAKATKKAIKKSDLNKIDFLLENISTLRPAVVRALVKTDDDVTKVMDKIAEGSIPTAKMEEFVNKLDDTAPSKPVEPKPEATPEIPSVGLASVKPPTLDEKLFDALGTLRTTNKIPRYTPDVIKNIREATTAKVAQQTDEMVPDVKATIKAIKDFDKEMRMPDKTGKPGPGLTVPYKTADGKRYSLNAQDLIDSLDPKDVKFLENFEGLSDEFKVYKSSATASEKAVSDENLMKLGIRAEDIPLLKNGVKLEDITDEMSVGDIKAITRDIRNKEIPDEAITHLYQATGTNTREALAKFIEANTATQSFKDTATKLARYGSHRTGATPLPHLGVSGHGKAAIPGKGFTEDDILAAKTPANPEQSIKFLEAKYNESALKLAAQPNGADLRILADKVFESAIDKQRTPAGPLRSKRGASVAEDKTKAKFETKYNTHSAMDRISVITRELRAMQFKTRNQYDDAYMAVLTDVDNRLRLAGFDPHLSNMRIMGDKLVVRLAPSDVLGALTKTQRINWIHGNARFNTKSSREMLPTTVMDVAEVLVRSATRLTPEGEVDLKALVTNAIHTLSGEFDKLGRGKREIGRNLDINTALKNDEEILRILDKQGDTGEEFAKQFREAKGVESKKAVVKVAMEKYPDEFTAIAKDRMTEFPYEVLTAFTKGFGEKPTILSDLININMRNASVFGGSVAKQIGEASAEYTAKVLNALDNGTAGDFLSELVIKPPFKVSDSTAKAIVRENQKVVQESLATPAELKHAEASVKGAGTKGNVEAYQKDIDLMEEVQKMPLEQDTEKLFDLAIRERNKDILYRMYGFSRFFNKRTGMPLSFDTISQSSHASALLMTGMHGIIRGWRARGITPEQLRVAMQAIKHDLPGDELSTELTQIMNNIFDSGKMNFLEKNSIGPKHFNEILESVGFDKNKFKVPENGTPEEMANAWKSWDIVHVEDFLSKMMRAVTKTAEDVSMGASFSKHFGQVEPGEGLVKIIDKSKSNSFYQLIDHDLYYPKQVAEELVHIGRLMTESRSFKPGTRTHTFVTKVMDPVISTLKMTQTTMKPGHHVMSVIGDGWRNNLALTTIGVASPARQVKLYHESYRILRSAVGDIDELSDFAQFDRMQGITSNLKIGSTRQGGFEVYPNIGKGGKVTHSDMYALMQAKGVALPPHMGGVAEDTLADFSGTAGGTGSKIINAVDKTASAVDRLMNPLKPKLGMKNPYSINKFTANRDTWSRGVMFLGAMRSKNFKSLEEAASYAAEFVHKWAPTAIDLGGMETKYARRMVFYYTWLRGMVPRVVEGTLMRPGVALIPNKAMYELGQANGIDLNSIGDPFPEDTLFPSWYSQKVLGPQWEAGGDLWGFNPTGPLGDTLNSLGSNISPKDFLGPDAYTKIAGTFLNMSTPWFKTPLELAQGKALVSDAPIEDPTQYMQDMIGPLRTASRVTGKDLYLAPGPDGLAMPNRTEKKFRNGMTEQQTIENALPELLNWATGMQFTNYTSDSAQNSAYYQDKQKLLDSFKMQGRF